MGTNNCLLMFLLFYESKWYIFLFLKQQNSTLTVVSSDFMIKRLEKQLVPNAFIYSSIAFKFILFIFHRVFCECKKNKTFGSILI